MIWHRDGRATGWLAVLAADCPRPLSIDIARPGAGPSRNLSIDDCGSAWSMRRERSWVVPSPMTPGAAQNPDRRWRG